MLGYLFFPYAFYGNDLIHYMGDLVKHDNDRHPKGIWVMNAKVSVANLLVALFVFSSCLFLLVIRGNLQNLKSLEVFMSTSFLLKRSPFLLLLVSDLIVFARRLPRQLVFFNVECSPQLCRTLERLQYKRQLILKINSGPVNPITDFASSETYSNHRRDQL